MIRRTIHGLSIALFCSAFGLSLSAAPRLVLSTASVGPVFVTAGSAGPAQTVEAYNAGSDSLNLTFVPSASWLSATVGAQRPCTTRSGNCLPINIALSTASLGIGTYTESLTVTDPNAVDSPQLILVSVTVSGVPASLNIYVTPSGGTGSNASIPIYPKSAITGKVTTASGVNWLALTTGSPIVSSGIPGVPYVIQAASQLGQAAGVYTGSIVVSGSSLAADNKTIAVTMNVTNSPIIPLTYSTVRQSGFTGGGKAVAAVTFANIGGGALNITGAAASSSSGNFLSASVASADTILVTADPGSLAPGFYSGSVTLTSNAANNAQVSVPVAFTVRAAGAPLINISGIINIADYALDNVSPGDILAVFGDQLASPGTLSANSGLPPLATQLGGVQVLVNNVPAPLYFSSPGQVNFQLPYEAPAGQPATVQVVANGVPGNVRSVNVAASAPKLMVWGGNIISGGYGIIVNQDYSLTLPSTTAVSGYVTRPAKPGETLTIYCVGLGQTTPGATTGAGASSSPLQSVPKVTVTFGGGFQGRPVNATPLYAGLTPTQVGLYQVNVTIPADVPLGSAVPVTVNVNGTLSNFVYLAISK